MILTSKIGRLEVSDDTPLPIAKMIRDDIVGQACNPQDDHTKFHVGRDCVEWARRSHPNWAAHILTMEMEGKS